MIKTEEILVMRQEELKRLELIKKVIDKELRQKEASQFLGISIRQVKRLVKRVRELGSKGVIHALRGKANSRRIREEIKAKVLNLYAAKYKDFGATLASEKLAKDAGIKLSRETIRKWIRAEGYQAGSRKRRKHRLWRERKGYYGEMVQMDGSHHDWLEGRGERLVLMGYIDDATNRVYGRFYEYEGTIPALDSFKRYIKKYGIPTSVYLDRHSTYKVTHYDKWKAAVLGEEDPLSQFERALGELGVRVIHAKSAPAKGRVERLFRTLQDRLVKELRLGKARTAEEANAILDHYLIEHNRRYLIEPARSANLHRRAPAEESLDTILCIKKEHALRNDFTVVHDKKLYQVTQYTSQRRIEVRDHVDGRMTIVARGRNLSYKLINQLPVKKRMRLSRRSPFKVLDKGRSFGTMKFGPKAVPLNP